MRMCAHASGLERLQLISSEFPYVVVEETLCSLVYHMAGDHKHTTQCNNLAAIVIDVSRNICWINLRRDHTCRMCTV